MFTILAFTAVIIIVVFFHELGHFLAARFFKVKVETFSVGMGPEAFSFIDKHKTKWRLGIIPVGGYVKMLGEYKNMQKKNPPTGKLKDEWHKDEKSKDFLKKHAFNLQSPWKKIIIVFAGPIFSVLLGFLIFTSVLFVNGENIPHDMEKDGIGKIIKGSPAEKAGLIYGDKLLEVRNYKGEITKIKSFNDLFLGIQSSFGKEIKVLVNRKGNLFDVLLIPNTKVQKINQKSEVYYQIGVSMPKLKIKKMGFFSAIKNGFEKTFNIVPLMFGGIYDLISGNSSLDDVGGPVKIAILSGEVAEKGFVAFIIFVAFLSINLGVINMIPLPVLDGGQILIYTLEIFNKKIANSKIINGITIASILFLVVFTIFITFKDISGL